MNGIAAPAVAPSPAPKPQPTLAERHAQVIAGFDAARTEDYLNKMATWAKQFPFLDWQTDEQSDHYHAAMERPALASGPAPRRPTRTNA